MNLFLSVGDSDDFAFGGIKFHQPVRFPCLLPVCLFLQCVCVMCCVGVAIYMRRTSAKGRTVAETWFGRSSV